MGDTFDFRMRHRANIAKRHFPLFTMFFVTRFHSPSPCGFNTLLWASSVLYHPHRIFPRLPPLTPPPDVGAHSCGPKPEACGRHKDSSCARHMFTTNSSLCFISSSSLFISLLFFQPHVSFLHWPLPVHSEQVIPQRASLTPFTNSSCRILLILSQPHD